MARLENYFVLAAPIKKSEELAAPGKERQAVRSEKGMKEDRLSMHVAGGSAAELSAT